jgi:amidophosphoribosyltransferase
LVSSVFASKALDRLSGHAAVGHLRYSTAGGGGEENLQPIKARQGGRRVALVHNGNLTNAGHLRARFESEGRLFRSTTDTEVFAHLMAEVELGLGGVTHAVMSVEGSFSLLVLTLDHLVAVRDPWGFRPLVLGRLDGAAVFASETTALDLIGADYEREVRPGEMVIVPLAGGAERVVFPWREARPLSRCVFEHLYFSRPDSRTFGADVHAVRKELGRALFREGPVGADLVIPVPDSGIPAATGYAEASGIPFDMGIIRSHYVGRSFLKPEQSQRDLAVRMKLAGVRSSLGGRRVVVVDDSLVRGTTSKKIIRMLRDRGAREVHLRISSPPTISPCYYGIDTPTREELIAAHSSLDEVCRFVGADSLGYLSHDGMMAVAERFSGGGFCSACHTGEYPTTIEVRRRDDAS